MSEDTRDLRGARWSTAVRCARAAVYQGTGAPRAEPSQKMLGYFLRGDVFGKYAARELVIPYYRAQGRRPKAEAEVPWPPEDPIAICHPDIIVPHEKRVIEVYSNTGLEVLHHKCLQGAGCALALGYREVEVLVIDPNTSEYITRPVDLDALEPEVRQLWDAVYAGVVFGQVPERVCRTPWDSMAFGCPFVAHCFQDWEEPPGPTLKDINAVAALASVRNRLSEARKDVERLAEEERLQRERLPIEPDVWHLAGNVEVKRQIRKGRRTLSLSDMKAAGVELPPHVQEWIKEGDPYEVWYIREAKP